MAQHGRLTRKEKKEIRRKRRILRKDLIKRGIRSRHEFEMIAQQMGLVYGNSSKLAALFFKWGGFLGGRGLVALLATIMAAMSVVYGYSALQHQKEDFTISLSGNLQRIGFDLSETEGFEAPNVRLASPILTEANAMSVSELPEDLDQQSGSHNGKNYMAYTFWVRNNGERKVDYDWHLVLNEVTKEIDKALWIMIYDEGQQTIYAKAPEGAEAEKLAGYDVYPLYDQAANPDSQYYTNARGEKGIAATPYTEEREVANGTVTDFRPEDKHKYTVVMWMEGDDPECINTNLGGKAVFAFKFVVAGDKDGVFDDIIYQEEDYLQDMKDSEDNNRNPLFNFFNRKN